MLNSFISHEMKMSESRNPRNKRLKPASVLVYNKTMGGSTMWIAGSNPIRRIAKQENGTEKLHSMV